MRIILGKAARARQDDIQVLRKINLTSFKTGAQYYTHVDICEQPNGPTVQSNKSRQSKWGMGENILAGRGRAGVRMGGEDR